MEGDSPAARVKTRRRSSRARPAESISRDSDSLQHAREAPAGASNNDNNQDAATELARATLEAMRSSPRRRVTNAPPALGTATPPLPTPPTRPTPTASVLSHWRFWLSSAQDSLESSEAAAARFRPHPRACFAPRTATLPTPPNCTRENGGQELTNTCYLPPEVYNLEAKPSPFTARAQYMPESDTNPMRQTLCGPAPITCDQLTPITNPFRAMDIPGYCLEPPLEALQSENITFWEPASLLRWDSTDRESAYALLVLNQPIKNLSVLRLVWMKAFFRIAADGGANRLALAFQDPCLAADLVKPRLDVICGDLDSLSDQVKEDSLRRGTKIVEEKDQNSTDFTKCVKYLRQTVFPHRPWSSNILCLGGLGGRVDQGLSQLHHLYMEQNSPTYETGRVYLLSTEAITFVLKSGRHSIRVHDRSAPILGKHIGIIPLKGKSIITTVGLEWDVTEWETEMGGQISTSNHVRADVVHITTSADVLFTIDLNFPDGNHDHMEPSRKSLRSK